LTDLTEAAEGSTLVGVKSSAARRSGSPSATVDRLLTRVRPALVAIEEEYRRQGRSVAELGVDELAGRMAAVVPAPSPVNALFGPFYRTDQVVSLLGVTRQAVADRVRQGSLLAMRTEEGTWVYPVLQFERKRVLPQLAIVLRAFDRGSDGWAVAAWLVSPNAALSGEKPIDCIRGGRDVDRVAELARLAGRRWAS
jgi:hypothetical protein